jgi:serine protease Do
MLVRRRCMAASLRTAKRGMSLPIAVIVIVGLWSSAVFAAVVLGGRLKETPDSAPLIPVTGLGTYDHGSVLVAKAARPSVVFIEVEGSPRDDRPVQGDPGSGLPEPWRRFFGPGLPFPEMPQPVPPGVPMGQGSGVVIDPGGYILTNNHVVGNASRVTVYLPNGESYPAEVVGTDKLTDLAVIKVDAQAPLSAAKLGDASQCEPGSWVMAVGFPFGVRLTGGHTSLESTVTVGVISARGRQLRSDIPGRPFRDLMQTDAPINPGNSGGPLLNNRAEVIGINQAILTGGLGGGNIGVGFAIPVDARTTEIIDALKRGKPVVRGQIGVAVEDLTSALKSVYGADRGVFVNEVQPDGPAARAGMKGEDMITDYRGENVTSSDQLVSLVTATKPGSTVDVEVIRDGKPMKLKVTVSALSSQVAERQEPRREHGRLGLSVADLRPDEVREVGLAGVRVVAVDPRGDGARAGIQPGDVVVSLNRRDTHDTYAFERAVAGLKEGEAVVVRVWRSGHMFTAQIDRLSR